MLVDFSDALGSIHRKNIEQTLLAYGLPKETVTAIMILYKNTKTMVRLSERDTDWNLAIY